MGFLTGERAFWIFLLITVVIIMLFSPSAPRLEPQSVAIVPSTTPKPSTTPTPNPSTTPSPTVPSSPTPNTQATEQAQDYNRQTSELRAKWQELDPAVQIIVWSVRDTEKAITGKVTVGILQTIQQDGYAVELPAGVSKDNALVIAQQRYNKDTIQLTTQSTFDEIFIMKVSSNFERELTIAQISDLLKAFEPKAPKEEQNTSPSSGEGLNSVTLLCIVGAGLLFVFALFGHD